MEQVILVENSTERVVTQDELQQLKKEAAAKEIRLREVSSDSNKIKKLTKLEG